MWPASIRGPRGRLRTARSGSSSLYAALHGRWVFLDRALYLPEEESRREAAGVPEEVEFATKGEVARKMIKRAFEAGVPASWVATDEVHGNDGALLHRWLEARGRSYVLAVSRSHPLATPLCRGRVARRRSSPRRRRRPGNE